MAKTRFQDNFYGRTPPSADPYSGVVPGTEVNMRQEFNNTMDGHMFEISKAQYGLLRKIRTDSDGNAVWCPCVDKITQEPDKDRFCPDCYGEGNLWDERPIQMYKVIEGLNTTNALRDRHEKPGLINIPIVVFYIRYENNISKLDKIVQIELDKSGNPAQPLRRKAVYSISSEWDYRSDQGKLEYWKIYSHEMAIKYLNAPSRYGVA